MRTSGGTGVRVGSGLLCVAALCCGGCATDWGVRRGPTLEELGAGIAALGAAVGTLVGLEALRDAGGGENMEYLFTQEHEWNDSRW